MLVYGDQKELADPKQRARRINRQLDRVERLEPGLVRHAALVAVLVEAGQLQQGLADEDFAEAECDRRTASTDEIQNMLLDLGHAVCRSWDSGFQELGRLARVNVRRDWPEQVELRSPEGFAFYAVYPEAYADAARRLKLGAAPRVIGTRSIGTSLGAVVAAALGARSFVTVRPFGNPFERKIAIDAALESELLDGEAHYVIVDEGPGQSGSSFGAVADWLRERGVPDERIALLPSHAGPPGSEATPERRRWWASVQQQIGDFGDRWPAMVQRWCEPVLGPLDQVPQDISGGDWRGVRYAREEEWPAVVPAWERRKFLVRANGSPFLVKFAGVGRTGDEKFAIARSLHSEGLVPEPIGLAHGFLIERWCDHGSALAPDERPLREIAGYIATRAKLLPATSGSGASAEELLAMASRNISLELGADEARALEPWDGRAAELDRRIVRVRTDNKLERHEWLRTTSGALLKTDALDHHQAHDLIGCQDVAWDVAGAIVEFDLDQKCGGALIAEIDDCGCRVDRELLDFYRIPHLAFRLGQARLGASMISDPSERRRLNGRGDRYAAELQHLLESTERPTRRESLVS